MTIKGDPINPDHYKSISGIEAIDVIEAFDLDFCRANAVKYILRAGKKDDVIQDINKGIWYLERYKKQILERRERDASVPF